MLKSLWDGEMDCGWNDLETMVIDTATRFRREMLRIVDYSPVYETRELINRETMDRFLSISRIMSEDLEMGFYYQYEDENPKIENAYKLNLWIVLGSLTEFALQLFLAFYIEDYKRSKWQQWEETDVDKIKNPIVDTINSLVKDGTITSSQGKTLRNAIKDKIKEHTLEHPVQKIMLDEIIQYYVSMELLDEDEVDYLKCIQSNRNGIHSFESRSNGTWSDLQYSIRFWCYLLEWILFRLPEPDEF